MDIYNRMICRSPIKIKTEFEDADDSSNHISSDIINSRHDYSSIFSKAICVNPTDERPRGRSKTPIEIKSEFYDFDDYSDNGHDSTIFSTSTTSRIVANPAEEIPTDIYDRIISKTPTEITSEFDDFNDYSKNIYGPCTSHLPEIVRRTVLRRARNKISSRKSRLKSKEHNMAIEREEHELINHNTKLNLELQNIRRAEKKLRVACKRISILIRTLNQ